MFLPVRFWWRSILNIFVGDPTKAKTLLGWNPTKTSFEQLVQIMVNHDMNFVKKLHLKARLDKE